ncbi:MAG: oxygenase MpaB family protein [Acidimicrobiia bacterium]
MFTDEYLDGMRSCGDPLADEVVEDFERVAGVEDPRYLVQRLIAHQRELPPADQVLSVRAYFEQPPEIPAWVDVELLRRGQRFFNMFGVHIASALFCASLPMSYTAADGAQVLTHTMALVSDTRRRLAQTGEMLLDVMGANDASGSHPFAPGTSSFRAPHGVRLFHAAVRRMLRGDPSYDRSTLGEPVNQEDLLGTLLAFTVVVIEALERFGVQLDEQDRDSYVHLWLTAGALLGIHPENLLSRRTDAAVPLRWDELVELRDVIARRNAASSESGRVLMRALLDEEREALPFPLKGLPRACTRQLIGDEYSAYLDVPPAGWTRVLLRPLPLVNRTVFGRVYYDLAGWLFAKLTRCLYRSWISRASQPGPHPWRYKPVVTTWKLEPLHTRAWRCARHPVATRRERCASGSAFGAR